MKKILIAFDGLSYTKDSAAFAIRTAVASDSLLVGVFLYDLRYARLLHTYRWDVPLQHYYYDVSKIERADEKVVHESIKAFRKQCDEAGVHYKVHLDRGVPLLELLNESAFADLIIIDTKTSLFDLSDHKMSTFLKDLLVEARCPILIVPPRSTDIRHVFVAYDGSESSVLALKMFSYLFPEWNELSTTVLFANRTASNHLPRNSEVKDLAARHFRKVQYKVLNGEVDKVLIDFLKKHKEKSVVVMGSYGRSALSRMFHSSLSNKVIEEVKVPVFITHQ
ncbi:MAG: universal stress protein [Chitinophagales bacterium]|nr:universal stress protein [Chitinophagales bacterium]